MANILEKNKQIAIIGALAEGSSIRSIECMTGTHRDTIMRGIMHMGQYLREYDWRYNVRGLPDTERAVVALRMTGGKRLRLKPPEHNA